MTGEDRHRGFRVAEEEMIDLTVPEAAPVSWLTASADVALVDAAGSTSRWRRASRPMRPVPKGSKHAFGAGDSVAVCGVPLAELHAWNDQPFTDGLLNRCPSCLELVRSGVADRRRAGH